MITKKVAKTCWALKTRRGRFRVGYQFPAALYGVKWEARDDAHLGDEVVKVRATIVIRET